MNRVKEYSHRISTADDHYNETEADPCAGQLLESIGKGGKRGSVKSEIDASGVRAWSQLRTLMNTGYVEWGIERAEHGYVSDHVRFTEDGKQALAGA